MTVDLKRHPDSDGDSPHSSPSLLSTIKRKILGGKAKARDRFASLGVYGFAKRELPILAALVTEDPLLLIGLSGTGKTYLLNSISEALNRAGLTGGSNS